MKCVEELCNKEACFKLPFYKLNGKQLIVVFYEYRCKDHMIYTKSERKAWTVDVVDKTRQG